MNAAGSDMAHTYQAIETESWCEKPYTRWCTGDRFVVASAHFCTQNHGAEEGNHAASRPNSRVT
jgi:hypothetical protein